MVIRDLGEVLRISQLPLTLDLVLALRKTLPRAFLAKLDFNSITVPSFTWTLIGYKADFMSSISVRQNPSTQTFKYIRVFISPNTRCDEIIEQRGLGNFVGF